MQVFQAHAICAALRAFAATDGGVQPLILAGDFNSLAEKRVSDEYDSGAHLAGVGPRREGCHGLREAPPVGQGGADLWTGRCSLEGGAGSHRWMGLKWIETQTPVLARCAFLLGPSVMEGGVKVSGVYELLSRGRVAKFNTDHPARRNSPAELGCLKDVSGRPREPWEVQWWDSTPLWRGIAQLALLALACRLEYCLAGSRWSARAQGLHGTKKAWDWCVRAFLSVSRGLALGGASNNGVRKPGQGVVPPAILQVEWTSAGLDLESAAVRAWGREPSFTNHTPSFTGCLDYVWLSRGDWEVVAAMELPSGPEAAAHVPNQAPSGLGPMPNATEPSNHVALGFCLRRTRQVEKVVSGATLPFA